MDDVNGRIFNGTNRTRNPVDRFNERAVLTSAVCRELRQTDADTCWPGGRPVSAYGLLMNWIRANYDTSGHCDYFDLGLDDPDLKEYAPQLLAELELGTEVCSHLCHVLWEDTGFQFTRALESLRRAVDYYWSQMS